MIYYSIFDPNGQFVTIVEENWIDSITSFMEVKYKEKIKICKINVDRYEKINNSHIKDKINGETIICIGKDIEQGLNKLNELNRKRERHNARIRAMRLI